MIITAASDTQQISFLLSGDVHPDGLASILKDVKERVNTGAGMLVHTAGFVPVFDHGKPAFKVRLSVVCNHAPSLLAFLLAKLRRVFPQACVRAPTTRKPVSISNLSAVNAVMQAILSTQSWPGLDEVHAAAEPSAAHEYVFNFHFWWTQEQKQLLPMHSYMHRILTPIGELRHLNLSSDPNGRVRARYGTSDPRRALLILVRELPKQPWFRGFSNDEDADDSFVPASDKHGIREMLRSIMASGSLATAAAEPRSADVDFQAFFDLSLRKKHPEVERILDQARKHGHVQVYGDELTTTPIVDCVRVTFLGSLGAVAKTMTWTLTQLKTCDCVNGIRLDPAYSWMPPARIDPVTATKYVIRHSKDQR